MSKLVERLRAEGKDAFAKQYSLGMWKLCDEAAEEIEILRKPWRGVDRDDWQYINSVIPDGGRGRFWKQVLAEMRVALAEPQ